MMEQMVDGGDLEEIHVSREFTVTSRWKMVEGQQIYMSLENSL